MRGWSPDTTSSVLASPTLSRAARSESPVPSGCCWTATVTPSSASAASGERTTTSGSAPSGRTASTTQSTRRRPSSGCRCFGVADFIREPRPAAMTTAARSLGHLELGRQDSNLGSRDQNPLPYHLATPHHTVSLQVSQRSAADAAGRRPRRQSRHGLDGRRRKRRLSTWLRPTVEELRCAESPRRDTQERRARRLRSRRSPRA